MSQSFSFIIGSTGVLFQDVCSPRIGLVCVSLVLPPYTDSQVFVFGTFDSFALYQSILKILTKFFLVILK
jgi:hypothetical protein